MRADGGAGRGGGGAGAGLGAAATGGGAATGFGGGAVSAGFAALPASSSAMMRRMEAKISSMEGSWAFADWVIAEFPRRIRLKAHPFSAAIATPSRRANRHCQSVIRQRDTGVAVVAQEP